MKKLIAILMVLAIVAGFAFADTITGQSESHTVVVKADVAETLPAFSLKVSTVSTNGNAEVFHTNPSYTLGNKETPEGTEIDFELDEADTFTAEAHVINNVKTNHGFTLTFSDGVFGVKRNTVGGYYSPSSISVENGDEPDCIKEYGTPVASSNNADSTTNTVLRSSTTVTFSGTKLAGDDPDVLVATATYTYPGDRTIDPTATNEYYYANVVLTVTAL